jgi:hypothetical protein
MDTFTTVVMLLIAFLAWDMGFDYIFLGFIGFIILLDRKWGTAIILGGGVAVTYYFSLKQYWYVLFFIIVAYLLIKEEKSKGKTSGESYSPELMNLLGGY